MDEVGLQQHSQSLTAFLPFLISANVRGKILIDQLRVPATARGLEGQLVLGELLPGPEESLTVADQQRQLHTVSSPQRVIAVLGRRDSSTHCSAVLPANGLIVRAGTELHWVAGESGIVGRLERDACSNSLYAPESAAGFRCIGMVVDQQGEPLTVERFAVRPEARTLSTPVLLVAATSSEAGKTVLAAKLIRRLSDLGLRVGAIKATGTGGVMDSLRHAAAGAEITLDHVDAGLITTHGVLPDFSDRLTQIFRKMQDQEVDLILAELGGDLVSASNPQLFATTEIVSNVRLMLVICNDALAAAGVRHVNQSRLRLPDSMIRYVSSPFRNHIGMAKRMNAVGVEDALDPNSGEELAKIARQVAKAIGKVQNTGQ